jgi:hypothetical protein
VSLRGLSCELISRTSRVWAVAVRAGSLIFELAFPPLAATRNPPPIRDSGYATAPHTRQTRRARARARTGTHRSPRPPRGRSRPQADERRAAAPPAARGRGPRTGRARGDPALRARGVGRRAAGFASGEFQKFRVTHDPCPRPPKAQDRAGPQPRIRKSSAYRYPLRGEPLNRGKPSACGVAGSGEEVESSGEREVYSRGRLRPGRAPGRTRCNRNSQLCITTATRALDLNP